MIKRVGIALGVALVFAAPVSAQISPEADPGRSERTREDLEELLDYYEEVLRSPVYSGGVKEGVRVNMERIRARLTEGDFRNGDRIAIYVEGETTLPDTVPVQTGPMITLPLFGDISLRGVLRSEIESHLTEQLGRFIRDPVVRAKGLMRVSIQGAVGAPGFYVVPADMLISEALMTAGGPANNARLDRLRVERGSEEIMGGEQLQEAMRDGLTLDQLNLQAGDQIVMPAQGAGMLGNIGIVTGLVGTVSFLVFRLVS